jgi:hypothetical protein
VTRNERRKDMRVSRFVLPTAVVLTILLMAAVSAHARVGVGVFVGEPSGISIKSWLSDGRAVDGVVGWSVERDDLHVHADYLWQRVIEDTELGGSVPLYYGLGVRFLARDEDSRFGVRIPVGLDYLIDDGRFDIFIEIAPIFDLVPETEFDLSAGIGARYCF